MKDNTDELLQLTAAMLEKHKSEGMPEKTFKTAVLSLLMRILETTPRQKKWWQR